MNEDQRRLRLLIVLRSFGAGGAERQMLELLRTIDQRRFEIEVVCFYEGPWHPQAVSIPGITVHLLRKRGRWDLFGFLQSLVKTAKRFRPDLIYGYMFAADLAALLAARCCGARVVFGLRSSEIDFRHYDQFTRFLQWASRRLAKRADLVISNSHAGLSDYRRGGARPRRALVIHNGVDCVRFRPDAAARAAARNAWGIAPDEIAIGLVARIDPMKGHDIFLHAAQDFLRHESRAVFVCVGSATEQNRAYAEQLQAQSAGIGLDGRVRWIGQTAEPEKVFPALDIATSASRFGEGFSNSVAEAMACGIPCVVTRVGDSAEIVGNAGIAVAAGDAAQLVRAWKDICGQPSQYSAAAARERIENMYSVARMVTATEEAFRDTFAAPPRSPRL
jgi:glycosyltransferase involved in cell wall biosynthesis